MNNNRPQNQQWFPGFLARMACCAVPSDSINNMVVVGDSYDNSDDKHDKDGNDVILHANTRQPFSQQLPNSSPATEERNIPSPTLSPSRRDMQRSNPSHLVATGCCAPSYAGSTATTASLMSEEDYPYYQRRKEDDASEEITSNATTQVVSHRQKNHQRNELLTSTLASAELRLKQQLREEEAKADTLKEQRRRWHQER